MLISIFAETNIPITSTQSGVTDTYTVYNYNTIDCSSHFGLLLSDYEHTPYKSRSYGGILLTETELLSKAKLNYSIIHAQF